MERLHGFIHGDTTEEPPLREFTRQPAVEEEAEEPTTPKAIRRRSLPTRASVTSLSSEFSVMTTTTVSAEEKTFQARRKRAAKLTQFFGVDYRDLMSEIIDSIEQGLQEESGRGTLRPDEVQVTFHARLESRTQYGCKTVLLITFRTPLRNCCKSCGSSK